MARSTDFHADLKKAKVAEADDGKEKQWDFMDDMKKYIGKSWNCWNLPEQPTEMDVKNASAAYRPPGEYEAHQQSTSLPPRYKPLFGSHPANDFISLTKCPACGWRTKVQHASIHFLCDSQGHLVCKDKGLAVHKDLVLGDACPPLHELQDTGSRRSIKKTPPKSELAKLLQKSGTQDNPAKLLPQTVIVTKPDFQSHSSSQPAPRLETKAIKPINFAVLCKPKGSCSKSNSPKKSSKIKFQNNLKNMSGAKSSSPKKVKSESEELHDLHENDKWRIEKPELCTVTVPMLDPGNNNQSDDLLQMPTLTLTYENFCLDDLGDGDTTPPTPPLKNTNARKTDPDYIPYKNRKSDNQYHSKGRYHQKPCAKKVKRKFGDNKNVNVQHNGSSTLTVSKTESKEKKRRPSLVSKKKSPVTSGTLSKKSASKSPPVLERCLYNFESVTKPVIVSAFDKPKPKKKKRLSDKDNRKIIPLRDRVFDPDKHCGVLDGRGVPCKRTLTCSTHSIWMRRNVKGRSKPFNELLTAHRQANKGDKPKGPPKDPPKLENESLIVKDVLEPVNFPPPKKRDRDPLIGGGVFLEPVSPVAPILPYYEEIETERTLTPFSPSPLSFEEELDDPDWNWGFTSEETTKQAVAVDPDSNRPSLDPLVKSEPEMPCYMNANVSQPMKDKNVRGRINIFSVWNPCETAGDVSGNNNNRAIWSPRQNVVGEDKTEVECISVLHGK